MKSKRIKRCLSGIFALMVSVSGISMPVGAANENVTTNGVIYTAPGFAYDPDRPSSRNSVLSPRAIQLQYQDDERDNGKMYATWETSVMEEFPERQGKCFPIYESEDYGETWTEVGRVVETQRRDWEGGWEIENCPHIFELPEDVGNMKKGGIVCFGDVCPRDLSQTHLDMYYSEDLGRTWEFVSTLVDDGGANYMDAEPGPVWEPFILYDPETKALICYYSDERDPEYGQKLVLQYTMDGENWSEVIDVVAQTDSAMRPGMPIVTQMENGYYVMVFEGVGLNYWGAGLPCNYKISKYPNDPIHWEAEDIGFTYGYGGSPYVATLPSGYIAMTASDNAEVFINTQKDLSGEFIKYPTGVPAGYNRQLIPIDDGTEEGALFTLSCEFPDSGKANSIKWGKLDLNTVTIPDTKATEYEIFVDEQNIVNIWPGTGSVKAGADQYFMVEEKRGCNLEQILINGQPADLQKSWFKVAGVNTDLEIAVSGVRTSEEARVINSKEEEKYFLCLPALSVEEGREVFEWTYENNNNFSWEIEPVPEKQAYRLRNRNSNRYLAAADVNLNNGKANVIQTSAKGENTLWKLTEVEEGWFSIISCTSGLAVTRGNMGDFGISTDRFAVQKPYEGRDDQLWGIDYALEDLEQYKISCDGKITKGSVTPNFRREKAGAVVYLTVTPNEGCELVEGSLKVNGEPVEDNCFVMPKEDVVITAKFISEEDKRVENIFKDVSADGWYRDYVQYVYDEKIMVGKDETHFAPDERIARAQFAVMLHRMEGEPEIEYKDTFPDVEKGIWYTDAILWAASTKVVTGYTDSGLFGPADHITREQMAMMMCRYAKNFKKYAVSEDGDYSKFPDAESVQPFAQEAMKWAVKEEIITGKTIDGKLLLDPQGSANRAECATIIQRFLEKYDK